MNNSFPEQENTAFDYYPKAITLGKQFEETKTEEPQQPASSPFSNLFSSNNPLFSQLLGGNPMLASLLSGNFNQADMQSKLMSSLFKSKETKDEKINVIDISNSIEEL